MIPSPFMTFKTLREASGLSRWRWNLRLETSFGHIDLLFVQGRLDPDDNQLRWTCADTLPEGWPSIRSRSLFDRHGSLAALELESFD